MAFLNWMKEAFSRQYARAKAGTPKPERPRKCTPGQECLERAP